MTALPKAVDHVIVAVRSLEEMAPRFAKLLGRPASWQGTHRGKGTQNALFRLSNMYLELMAPDGSGGDYAERLEAHLEERGEGIFGLSLETQSAEHFAKEMERRGFHPSKAQKGEGRDEQSGRVREWKHVFLPPSETLGLFVFAIEHLSPRDALPLMPPEDDASSVQAMDHIVLSARDAISVRALFGEKGLGLRLALEREAPDGGARMMFFRSGGTTLEAIAGGKAKEDAFWGLAWNVQDVQAAHARLSKEQFDVSPVRVGRKRGTDVCTVRDCGVPTLMIGPSSLLPDKTPAASDH